MTRALRRLARDRRGVTIVEMAFVLPSLVMVLLVLFDFSYRMYAQSVLEGTLQAAARQATIGDKTSTQIDDYIKTQLKQFSKASPPVIKKDSWSRMTDAANRTVCNDTNNNNVVDADGEYLLGADGLGGSDDIVFYTVTITFPRMFPLGKFLGWAKDESVGAKMILRNQPYGSQSVIEC